jgi:ribosomal protein S18 acetylase RimI-like enzyme
LRGVLAAAAQRGVAVRIHVEVNNPARSLYDRLGFREIETCGIYTLMEWRPEVATPTL